MRAVRGRAGSVVVPQVAEPNGTGRRLRVVSAGICGSDLAFVERGLEGFTLGHEFAGIDADGAAYAVEPTIACGNCEQCRTGHVQRCQHPEHGNLGIFRDGGMTEVIDVPETTLLPLPAGLDVRDACLVEPAAVAWHGLERAGVGPDERLAVVGAGSIGLLVVAAARRRGLAIDIDARHQHQCDAATRLQGGRPNGGYDVVIDAGGSRSALQRCADLARPGGRIVLLGTYRDTVPLPAVTGLTKELTYVHSMAYDRADGLRDFTRAAAMLAADAEIAETLITHRFALEDAPTAFRVAADRSSGAIKVVLHP